MWMLWLSWLFLPENDQTAKTKNLILSLVLCNIFSGTPLHEVLMVHYVEYGLHMQPSPIWWRLISQFSPSCFWVEISVMGDFFSKSFLKGWINGNKWLGLPLAHQVKYCITLQNLKWLHVSTKWTQGTLEPLGKIALQLLCCNSNGCRKHFSTQRAHNEVQLLQQKVL